MKTTAKLLALDENTDIVPNARAHERLLFGASPARKKMELIYRDRRSEENFDIFHEVLISRTMVVYREFITESATTRTLIVFTIDKVDNSSRS